MNEPQKFLSAHEIKKMYKNGERNFSNIQCNDADFTGFNLSGANFRNSNFDVSGFAYCNLIDTDFTGTSLKWCSFERAKLYNTIFARANLSYSKLNDARLRNTKFQNANLSWCLLFNVERWAGDFKGSILYNCAWNESEVTEQGLRKVRGALKAMKMSPETRGDIKKGITILERLKNIFSGAVEKVKKTIFRGYSSTAEKSTEPSYRMQETLYNSQGNYISDVQYGKRREKKPLDRGDVF